MILDEKQIEQLTRKGVKLQNSKGEPIRVKTTFTAPRKEEPEIEHLRRIEALLEAILSKPQPPFPKIPSPEITVQSPEVIVQSPSIIPPQPIRKWSFKVIKDFRGYTEEIIATALE